MKAKLMILATVALLFHPGYTFAQEDMNHNEHMGSTMQHQDEQTTTSPQAVEVGNKFCPVSGNKVDDGKMGEAVKIEHNGKIYNLCCPMCIKDFKKNPEKYIKILEEKGDLKQTSETQQTESHDQHDHSR